MEKLEHLYTAGGTVKWWRHSGKQILKMLKLVLPYDPAIVLLGIYWREMKYISI